MSGELLPIIDKKESVPHWSQNFYEEVEKSKNNPPKATRHLNRQVMCGACQFRCCLSNIWFIAVTEEEAEKLKTPLGWPMDGVPSGCRYLEAGGCRFGEERPTSCRLFPVEINFDKNHLKVGFWVLTHCPTPKDFVFDRQEGDKWIYKKREGLKGPKLNNILDEIILDQPIEKWPNILEFNSLAIERLYGTEYLESIREQLRKTNELDEQQLKAIEVSSGFDFGNESQEDR